MLFVVFQNVLWQFVEMSSLATVSLVKSNFKKISGVFSPGAACPDLEVSVDH